MAGAAVLFYGDRQWSPRFELDFRRVATGDPDVGDHTFANNTRGVAIRALGGPRFTTNSGGVSLFAQLSLGLEWQRETWEESFFLPSDPTVMSGGTQHLSKLSRVFEPAVGLSTRSGKLRVGLQLALAVQTNEAFAVFFDNRLAHTQLSLFAER